MIRNKLAIRQELFYSGKTVRYCHEFTNLRRNVELISRRHSTPVRLRRNTRHHEVCPFSPPDLKEEGADFIRA